MRDVWIAPLHTTHVSTGQLRARGWNDDDIERLGEPDLVRVEPYSGHLVRLFAWERVCAGPPPPDPEPRFRTGATGTGEQKFTLDPAKARARANARWARPGERGRAREKALARYGD